MVGDPAAPLAICVLTSSELMAPLAAVPGVAIAGEVQTANLGLESIAVNVVANPAIRFLLLCGRDPAGPDPGAAGLPAEPRGSHGREPSSSGLPR